MPKLRYALTLLVAGPALGEAPPSPSAPPSAPLATPNPNFITQQLEIMVNRPAAETWARIGRFCDMNEWFPRDCKIISGKEGELGAVREIQGGAVAVIVAVTPLSYTYAFPVRLGVPYTMQHNTLEVRTINSRRSRIVYSFIWDNSHLSPAQQEAEITARKERLTPVLQRMKMIVESRKPRA